MHSLSHVRNGHGAYSPDILYHVKANITLKSEALDSYFVGTVSIVFVLMISIHNVP